MERPKNLLSSDEYFDLLDETDLILNVGDEPEFNIKKNQYGINYETKDIELREKKVKALAKAHLYLHSLKPKFKQIEHYLRWHPKAADAKAYKAALDMYDLRLDEVRSEIKNQKEFFLPRARQSLEWSKTAKQHHEEFEIPVLKMLLAIHNRDKEAYNAQANLARELNAQEKEMAIEAQKRQNNQLRAAGVEPITRNTLGNQEAETLDREMKEEAEKAWANERQDLVNMIEGKQTSQTNEFNNIKSQFNINMEEAAASRKAYLNEVRAKKQKRLLAKQSQSRKARKNRKARRSTRRT